MIGSPEYATVAAAIEPTGMIARGGFAPARGEVPDLADGRPCVTVIVLGNISGGMWTRFRREEPAERDPLDRWTRTVLGPIASGFGADFLHPSDEPFQPFQRWARRADDVWSSPIGLLIHPSYGLWHAYRGAFLFADAVEGMPPVGLAESPCLTCADQPCLSTCPVDAFGLDSYDDVGCATHVRSGDDPVCGELGCAARLACPIGQEFRYDPDQMRFHMRAFAGG
jgi:hypothetical protein